MMRRVLQSPDLEPSAKVVLLCVLDHAGYGRTSCTASNGTISRESGLADRRTREILAVLVAGSWLMARRAGGKFGSRSFHPGPRSRGGAPPPGGWHPAATPLASRRQGSGTRVPPNGISNGPGNAPDPFASKWFGHLPQFNGG